MSNAPSFRSFLSAGLVAAVVAVTVNVVLFLVARAVGAWSTQVVTPMGGPIDVSAIATLSVAPALIGALLAWLLIRFVPRGRTVFLAIAAIVLLAFLLPPFQLGAPAGMVVVLQLMHLVVAAATVGMVVRASPDAA